jgi:hypothetical protein
MKTNKTSKTDKTNKTIVLKVLLVLSNRQVLEKNTFSHSPPYTE